MRHIVFTISELGGGGAERVVSVWASALAAQGMDVSIVLMHRQEDEYAVDPRVNVVALGETREAYLSMMYPQRLMKLRKTIQGLRPTTLINFLPRMQVMVYIATLGMKLYRIETIRNNPWKIYPSKNWESVIWNRCFEKADRVIVQTSGQRDFFSKKVDEKSVLIPNPINEVYTQSIYKEYSDTVRRFIAAGRLHPQKNYPMMIKAFAIACQNNKNIYLDIYGGGDVNYTKKLESLISSLGMTDRIFLRGKTVNLVNEYRSGDAYIMSSDYEGMPNALAEAMASELVCVSTDCPTGPEDLIIDGDTGYLVPVGDINALARKIITISGMAAQERKRMTEKAREFVLQFCSEENSLQQLLQILR